MKFLLLIVIQLLLSHCFNPPAKDSETLASAAGVWSEHLGKAELDSTSKKITMTFAHSGIVRIARLNKAPDKATEVKFENGESLHNRTVGSMLFKGEWECRKIAELIGLRTNNTSNCPLKIRFLRSKNITKFKLETTLISKG